jgi:hypothetical protein
MNARSIKMLASVTVALTAMASLPAAAGDASRPLGVVELFTSQGCSSCPPADEVFGDLVKQGDVLALAYHVDYWDYLGWRDTLGSAENTARQYEYGRSFAVRSVYTPQAVINGRNHVNGADGPAVKHMVERFARSGLGMSVSLVATRKGDSVVIEAGAGTVASAKAHLVLVFFQTRNPVAIERGENRGKTMTYWNSVSDVQTAGMWHGQSARFEFPASEIDKKDGCAALLQSVDANGLPGPILGATLVKGGGRTGL